MSLSFRNIFQLNLCIWWKIVKENMNFKQDVLKGSEFSRKLNMDGNYYGKSSLMKLIKSEC